MNNSSDTTTQRSLDGESRLIILLDSIILVLSLSGNSLVIYTIYKERKLHTTCNYLLLNLAICDLIVVSLGTSIDIMLQFTQSEWILGLFMCRTLNPAVTMFYISGSLILVVISLDRYKTFIYPLKARYQRKHVKYAVVIVHLISLVCVTPFAVFSTITDGHCYDVWPAIWYRKGYTVFLFIIQYALPLLIMGIAYIGVALSLVRSKSAFKKNFHIGRRGKHENTSTRSLVGALATSSPNHSKTSVTIAMVDHPEQDTKLRPLKHYNNQPEFSSVDEESKFYPEHEDEEESKFYQEHEESVAADVVDSKSVHHNGGKPSTKTFRCRRHQQGNHYNKNETDHVLTVPKSNRATTALKATLEETNNNGEPGTCNRCFSASPAKRHLSRTLPSYRRNAIRRRPGAGAKNNRRTLSKREKRNNRALKMILLVVVVFAAFMLPMQIMSLLLDFGGKPTREKYRIYAWFVMCSYFGSCTLNPFIYGLVDRTFRAGFKKIGRKLTAFFICTSRNT